MDITYVTEQLWRSCRQPWSVKYRLLQPPSWGESWAPLPCLLISHLQSEDNRRRAVTVTHKNLFRPTRWHEGSITTKNGRRLDSVSLQLVIFAWVGIVSSPRCPKGNHKHCHPIQMICKCIQLYRACLTVYPQAVFRSSCYSHCLGEETLSREVTHRCNHSNKRVAHSTHSWRSSFAFFCPYTCTHIFHFLFDLDLMVVRHI